MIKTADAYAEYLKSDHWKKLRQEVLARDGRKCVRCQSRDDLQAHHRFYRENWTDSITPDLITLCRPCHEVEHGLRAAPPSPAPAEHAYSRLEEIARLALPLSKGVRKELKEIRRTGTKGMRIRAKELLALTARSHQSHILGSRRWVKKNGKWRKVKVKRKKPTWNYQKFTADSGHAVRFISYDRYAELKTKRDGNFTDHNGRLIFAP